MEIEEEHNNISDNSLLGTANRIRDLVNNIQMH